MSTVETMQKTIRVVLVDDHAPVRRNLKQLIELKGPYKVVGEGANGEEAIARVEELQPDIVLMDMNMPILAGAQATEIIKDRYPHIKVLALTAFADMSHVSAMVKAGASGYVLKGGPAKELLESLHAVAAGRAALDKEVTRGVMEDMAELYKKEQERSAALEELDRMKSEFVSVVSHELRTPVTTIKGGALTLQKHWAEMNDDVRNELLNSVARSCDHLSYMISRLLTVSGIQRGGIGLRPKVFSLGRLAETALSVLGSKTEGRDLRVASEPVRASGDEERLTEVAIALIHNALEFTEGTVEVVVAVDGSEARLAVVDEGPGMTPESVNRMIEKPFTQGDSSSTRRVGGLGLSLYIARQVLEASGGRLEIDTSPASGSRFTMVLPTA